MTSIPITSSLKSLIRGFDNIIICKDLKRITVPIEGTRVQYQLELTQPIEYTREGLLSLYDLNTKCSRWAYTYTEDGQDAIAIVINGGNENE